METAYPEKIVTFIDILGFANLVQRIGHDPALHRKVTRTLAWVGLFRSSSEESGTAQSKLQITTFSDSVVITGDASELHSIFWTSLMLQAELLGIGVLLRGGISVGRVVHEAHVLYGEGMLRAYALESKVAVYPRIVIDDLIQPLISPAHRQMFLRQDSDGMWFLDPFSVGIGGQNSEALLEDGGDPHEEALKALREEIARSLSRVTDASQRVKWTWLQNQLAIAETDFHRDRAPRFWAFMKNRWPTQ